MTSIDGISPVDIGANQIPFGLVLTENICLMSAGVGSEHMVSIDVICVRPTSPRVIRRESKRIKVLGDSDDRRETVVAGEHGGRLEGLVALET